MLLSPGRAATGHGSAVRSDPRPSPGISGGPFRGACHRSPSCDGGGRGGQRGTGMGRRDDPLGLRNLRHRAGGCEIRAAAKGGGHGGGYGGRGGLPSEATESNGGTRCHCRPSAKGEWGHRRRRVRRSMPWAVHRQSQPRAPRADDTTRPAECTGDKGWAVRLMRWRDLTVHWNTEMCPKGGGEGVAAARCLTPQSLSAAVHRP